MPLEGFDTAFASSVEFKAKSSHLLSNKKALFPQVNIKSRICFSPLWMGWF